MALVSASPSASQFAGLRFDFDSVNFRGQRRSPKGSLTTTCSSTVDGGAKPQTGSSRPSTQNCSSSFIKQRRQVLAGTVALAIALPLADQDSPAGAAESKEGFRTYKDEVDKYSMLVPEDWSMGEGKAGTRRVLAFYPPGNTVTNVNVVVTSLGADFTGMGSFGTAYAFGETLVNTLDRSWKQPPGQAAKLIDTKSQNGFYFVEYTLQPVGQEKKHLISLVGCSSNGWVNRLYTITGLYLEDEGGQYKEPLSTVLSSFKFSS